MDFGVKNSIELRRESFFKYYDVKDRPILEKIEEFFKKMEDLGESVEGQIDFESKFANSDLSDEFQALLKEVSLKCVLKEQYTEEVYTTDDLKEVVKDTAKDELEYLGRNAVIETRSAIDKELGISEGLRKNPVIGTAMDIGQHVGNIVNIKDFFKKRKENKDKDKDNDNKDKDKE